MFKSKINHTNSIMLIVLLFLSVGFASAQTNEFTYQGKLTDNSMPATGNYDFIFSLHPDATNVVTLGTVQRLGVPVSNGVFTVTLDFAAANFNGSDRYLEIKVKPAGSPNPYTPLTPRQKITSAPYAIRSSNAANADTATLATNSQQLGGTAANQFVQTDDSRLTDSRNPLAGSVDYLQNRTTQQATTNFNISGGGTLGGTLSANAVTSATQYNIGINRVLSASTTTGNTFVGPNTGSLNSTGTNNSFIGSSAGFLNTTGSNNTFVGKTSGFNNRTGVANSFFGTDAGQVNTDGSYNSFFGASAGLSNTSGANSFFGSNAGEKNTTGIANSFFGASAGTNNTTAAYNAFFGARAGFSNTTGNDNSFFGHSAGDNNMTGIANSFFGANAGLSNTMGNYNSFFGASAGQANTGRFNSFFGANAGKANTSSDANSFFGNDAGQANTLGTFNSFFGADAGRANLTGAFNSFFGSGAGASNTTGSNNSFFGRDAGQGSGVGQFNSFFGDRAGFFNFNGNSNSFFGHSAGFSNVAGFANSFFGQLAGNMNDANFNSFFGRSAGEKNTTGEQNSFFGYLAGNSNTTGSSNTIIGNDADVGSSALTNATAIGANAFVSQNNSLVLGSINGVNNATADTKVGIGTSAPEQRLHVVGNEILSTGSDSGFKFRNRGSVSANDDWVWYSSSNIARLFRAGSGDLLTVTTSGVVTINSLGSAGSTSLCRNASNQISTCSSSLRYKQNINPFNQGLSLIKRLRPVSFNWKAGNQADLGLVAEEVNQVEPLLTTTNEKGDIEGVKYDRVGVVLINAVNEQQTQIEAQQKQIQTQEEKIEQQKNLLTQQQQQIDALKQFVCQTNPQAEICKQERRK